MQAAVERGRGAARDRLVGLAEPLAALRVADEGPVHAELAQHRRRDLARERTLGVPVAVLREHADLGAGERLHRRRERDVRRADDDVDAVGRSAMLAKRAAERSRPRSGP